ncbi:acetyl/propionyl/methylcrotonyl-CoA carboxylase subunit alpha [Sedimenticola thiotaurini]|uniref:Biotin carboxylase n=1 Tax=Sedimenticola thiotaurini TaxID=1543721 RepID=A0A0F7JUZ1_9GAMM|nr:acetyl/propionyl/methylcrotonyl-CoA carboxylase subunit alpha [Sedimenticola thiotaurini]AKH19412.1 3-methylcrotonyl-CoA carboxylase [Sedimenticola thiotaurini]
MFDKILIANRGEIACRVARTARRLGITTVAVYSEADADAMHVTLCDEAYLIGPAAAKESYLRADKILAVAKASGAQAVHPGYGFLSENAEFAEACQAAGIVFIGPPAAAIIAMGSKSEAKRIMSEAGVPLVPGYHGDDQSDERLRQEADAMGYPLLIKATAGGGGKGMRVVEKAGDFLTGLNAAKREAIASFGDDKVLLERYLLAPRHVELQVFADTQGNAVHLFERDCSVQRRHQKVLEEAPAPGMTPELRDAMGEAAINAAKAIGYVGAGTVEFLLDSDGKFYFMEMNTRLQVEHPVTEMISGQDLVEWQLKVAAGEALPLAQSELRINGHAFEARVYAENPAREFLPATGTLRYLQTPETGPCVRVDTGVEQGDEVSVHYDPMIAKLIVWGEDRASALHKLRAALADYRIVGVTTNLEFLSTLCALPAFGNAELDTGFIDKHEAELFPVTEPVSDDILAIAALYELLVEQRDILQRQARSNDPFSPWGSATGWRMNQDSFHQLHWASGEQQGSVVAHYRDGSFLLELPGGDCLVSGELLENGDLLADLAGRRFKVAVIKHDQELTILHQGRSWQLLLSDPRLEALEGEGAGGSLVAPMTGNVIAIHVQEGDAVKQGDAVMIVEAMKMEHTITAPADGTVKEVRFAVGDQVQDGEPLLVIE